VIAIERAKRLEHADVALLAVLASRFAVALSVHGKTPDETRPGFAA
jgi:hypothetical protein